MVNAYRTLCFSQVEFLLEAFLCCMSINSISISTDICDTTTLMFDDICNCCWMICDGSVIVTLGYFVQSCCFKNQFFVKIHDCNFKLVETFNKHG